MVLVVLLLAGAGAFVFGYAPKARREAVQDLERELNLRADERQTAVNAWLADRLDDVRTIAQFPTVRQLVGMPTEGGPGIGDGRHLATVLTPFLQHRGLNDLFVVDAAGRVVANARGATVHTECASAAVASTGSGEHQVDVHAHADGSPAVQFVVALGEGGGRVVAESLAGDWLCPLVKQAALASGSAEWRLVHQVGDEVTWVCSTTDPNVAPLAFRRPMSDIHEASVGALRGEVRFGRYTNVRGAPVFAAMRPLVPGWGLVLKVDEAEVLAGVRRQLLRVGTMTGGLAVGLAALALVAWRSRERAHELSIARARARQATLIEQANEAILFVAPDGRVLDANSRATTLYGRSRGQLVGLSVQTDLRSPEEHQVARRQLDVVAGGQPLVFETIHLKADCTPIPIEVSSTLVHDESGAVIVSVFRDIGERRAAQRRMARLNRVLRAASEVNHLLVKNTDVGRLLSDACRLITETGEFEFGWIGRAEADGRLVPVAARGAEAHLLEGLTIRWDESPFGGGPSARAIRTRRSQLIADALAEPSLAPWRSVFVRAALRSAVVCPVFLRDQPFGTLSIYSADVEAFDAETVVLLEKLAGDLGFGLQAIEDRRQRAASEAQFRAVFDNAALGIGLARLDGRPVRANPALCRMLGYTEPQLCALRFDSFTHPDDLVHETPLFEQVVAGTRDGFRLEKRFIRADGAEVWGALTLSAVRDQGRRPSFYIALVEDISERRRLQEQFLQAQKMESIGRLAGGVAHDFNNLLTAILGYADLLRSELPEGGDAPVFVDEIAKAGARATALTSQLLAFARRQVIEPRLVDLNAVVSDAERMLGRLVGEDVEMTVALAPGLGLTRADPGQLHQVLVNLVVNARDAMPTGGRLAIETADVVLDEAYARTQADLRPGAYVMLAVSDTGAGIAPELRPHLFEPFYTTKGPGRGTGLGLATCHGIVTQSGGLISVYSEPGLGSTFRVYLPRAERTGPEASRAVPEPGPLRGGEETLLLAEDEPAVRKLAALTLRSYGYRVIEAADGEQALALALAHQGALHLLVTDVVMPRLGGRELAKRFAGAWPAARVLFMSGHPERAIAHHGVLEPGTAFLSKPFTPERLARRVREVLDAS